MIAVSVTLGTIFLVILVHFGGHFGGHYKTGRFGLILSLRNIFAHYFFGDLLALELVDADTADTGGCSVGLDALEPFRMMDSPGLFFGQPKSGSSGTLNGFLFWGGLFHFLMLTSQAFRMSPVWAACPNVTI